ncbi:regulation of transcription from pol ii promoter-related protein, partial [Moniliophthora roreri]
MGTVDLRYNTSDILIRDHDIYQMRPRKLNDRLSTHHMPGGAVPG